MSHEFHQIKNPEGGALTQLVYTFIPLHLPFFLPEGVGGSAIMRPKGNKHLPRMAEHKGKRNLGLRCHEGNHGIINFTETKLLVKEIAKSLFFTNFLFKK